MLDAKELGQFRPISFLKMDNGKIVMVKEMLLRSINCDSTLVSTPMKAFMDDVAILSKQVSAAERVLARLAELTSHVHAWNYSSEEVEECHHHQRKQKELWNKIGWEEIPTLKQQPVKSLGRWYKSTLIDKGQGIEVQDMVEGGSLPGKFKCWCLQFGLYRRITSPLIISEVRLSSVERIEQRCSVYIRKWLGFPKTLNSTRIFGRIEFFEEVFWNYNDKIHCRVEQLFISWRVEGFAHKLNKQEQNAVNITFDIPFRKNSVKCPDLGLRTHVEGNIHSLLFLFAQFSLQSNKISITLLCWYCKLLFVDNYVQS